jgi:hypothetical protein
MLSGKYWPAHPHPFSGECFSSWLVRCAHANGLKVQTFCDKVFGKDYQVWSRDIDRSAPEWVVNIMSGSTGAPMQAAWKSTFKIYEKRLFPVLHPASQLRWVMPVKHFHRIMTGFGMQYCPVCLYEDSEPHYRLAWRLALYTFCPRHQVFMHDRCVYCQSPVAFHRIEQGKPEQTEVESLDCCWLCGARLSTTPTMPLDVRYISIYKPWNGILNIIDRQFSRSGAVSYQRLTLLHQVCRLLVSRQLSPRLQQYICEKAGYPFIDLSPGKLIFEQRDIKHRHYILQLAWWLITRNPHKLKTAIRLKGIRENELYRDLDSDFKDYILRMIH